MMIKVSDYISEEEYQNIIKTIGKYPTYKTLVDEISEEDWKNIDERFDNVNAGE